VPTKCMDWDGKNLKIWTRTAPACMHCIRIMPRALRPVRMSGQPFRVGAKAPILEGLSFPAGHPLHQDGTALRRIKESSRRCGILDGKRKNRERLGRAHPARGLREVLKMCDLTPEPRMINTRGSTFISTTSGCARRWGGTTQKV